MSDRGPRKGAQSSNQQCRRQQRERHAPSKHLAPWQPKPADHCSLRSCMTPPENCTEAAFFRHSVNTHSPLLPTSAKPRTNNSLLWPSWRALNKGHHAVPPKPHSSSHKALNKAGSYDALDTIGTRQPNKSTTTKTPEQSTLVRCTIRHFCVVVVFLFVAL